MNLENFPLISFIILLPLFGALFISLINASVAQLNAKYVALWTSVVTLSLSLLLWGYFDFQNPAHQFIDRIPLLPYFSLEYKAGVDGLSLACLLLTNFIFPLAILAEWDNLKTNLKFYTSLILALQSFLLCTLTSLNLLFFFICFEACLVPFYFLIGLWGSENSVYATVKFFLYMFFGSIFFLLGILKLYSTAATFDFTTLCQASLPSNVQLIVGTLFIISFFIKLPLVPFHTWLLSALVQAPTPISMLLGGVLLEVAAYGLLRFFPALFPYFLPQSALIVGLSALVATLYASWVAFAQTDMKKMIAYSTISHLGLVVIGIAVGTVEGLSGALFQVVSYGFIAAGLFFGVGILYDRVHSRKMEDFGGLARVMPIFSILFFILSLGAIGLPGTSGFIGGFFILLATFKEHIWWGLGVGINLIFTAIYMIGLYKNVFFHTITSTLILGLKDLNTRERFILIIFSVLVVGIGFYPKPLLKMADHTFMKRVP